MSKLTKPSRMFLSYLGAEDGNSLPYLLAQLGNVNYVWFAFPIAEVASATLTILFLIKIKRQVIDKIGS